MTNLTVLPQPDQFTVQLGGRQESDIIAEVGRKFGRCCYFAALNGEPQLFRGPAGLVRLLAEQLQPASEDYVRGALAKELRWEKPDGSPGRAPVWLAKELLSSPPEELPPLHRVTHRPYLFRNQLLAQPGYHYDSATWQLGNMAYPEMDLELSLETLDSVLGDFPFADVASKTHALLAMVQPMLRLQPTPMWVIEAPVAGTGKSLLAALIGFVGTGRFPSPRPLSEQGDEVRKVILAELLAGTECVLFDNAADGKTLDSPVLAGALTAKTWTDRILRSSKVVSVPIHCQWIVTSNNPLLTTELARRSVRIRLDSGEERPWNRSGFRHENLLEHIEAFEGPLVGAAIGLIRHWLEVGMVRAAPSLGSFEQWSMRMGGIGEAAGLEGFLANPITEDADDEASDLAHFVELWWELKQDTECPASLLTGIAEQALPFVVGVGQNVELRQQSAALSRWLLAKRGRRSGDYVISGSKSGGKYWLWQLQPYWNFLKTNG